MLISQAIAQCTALTGQVVDTAVLVRWLSELDGRLAFEFYRTDAWTPYDPTDDLNCELLVPFPWDGLYIHHLAAQTYFSNGEYDRYDNERVMSEKTLADFRSFMQRTQARLCGCPGFPTEKAGGTGVTVIPGENYHGPWFWLSAYALAVKHGYKGTEEEWLNSVAGPNVVTEDTLTDLSGVLYGNGSTVDTKAVDITPTDNSTNLVTSGGVKIALTGVGSTIGVELHSSDNLDNIATAGFYAWGASSVPTNAPTGYGGCSMIVSPYASNTSMQLVTFVTGTLAGRTFRRVISAGTPGAWDELALKSALTQVSSSLYDGNSNSGVYKNNGVCNIICIGGTWYNTGGGTVIRRDSADGEAWVLPTGFRPINNVTGYDYNSMKTITIDTNGNVLCNTSISSGAALRFTFCYVAAE